MKLAIHQPQYMPWSGYFHKMSSVDLFLFLDDVQFKKNEWQHRNRIRSPEGWQWLSVPVSFNFPEHINQVAVRDETRWREKHLRSLHMCYGRAPFWSAYASLFEGYYSRPRKTLEAVNIESILLLASILGITTPTERTSPHNFPGVSTERLVNICRHFGATTYLAGAGGHDYMDLALFDKAGITVEFQDFAPPVYPQHWSTRPEDFIAGLSALDVLFNCGPESGRVLRGGD